MPDYTFDLPLLPELELGEVAALEAATPAPKAADYACLYCGEVISLPAGQSLPACPRCHHEKWVEADHIPAKF